MLMGQLGRGIYLRYVICTLFGSECLVSVKMRLVMCQMTGHILLLLFNCNDIFINIYAYKIPFYITMQFFIYTKIAHLNIHSNQGYIFTHHIQIFFNLQWYKFNHLLQGFHSIKRNHQHTVQFHDATPLCTISFSLSC